MDVLQTKKELQEKWGGDLLAAIFGDDDDPTQWGFFLVIGPENVKSMKQRYDELEEENENVDYGDGSWREAGGNK